MNRLAAFAALSLATLAAGCGDDGMRPPPEQQQDCGAQDVTLPDGSCVRLGIPLDGCGDGFVHDGEYGCEPTLPAQPCPPGLMALPGESTCRPVMACGDGKWGDLPIDAATIHVDVTYAGMDADGTSAKPWSTIGEAVTAAAPNALIAVAAGSYQENVVISAPVRLWGVCPELVEIVATGQSVGSCPAAGLCIIGNADGTEVGGLAVTGASIGIFVSGTTDMLMDRVHVHDNAGRGINVEEGFGDTAVEVRGALLEHNHEYGVFIAGAVAMVDTSVVRDTQPRASDQAFGAGVDVQLMCVGGAGGLQCDAAARSSAIVQRTLIERNHHVGMLVTGSDAILDSIVLRDTLPRPSNMRGGGGLSVQLSCIEGGGEEICDPTTRASVEVYRSLIDHNHDVGVFITGGDAIVDATVVRDTIPRASDQIRGRAFGVQNACSTTNTGIDCHPLAVSTADLRSSLIEQSYEFGLLLVASQGSVTNSVIRAIKPSAADNLFGDGITVVGLNTLPSVATVSATRVDDSARAGISSFGAAISLEQTQVRCAAFALAGEPLAGIEAQLDDRGANLCGCPEATAPCKLASVGLEPPQVQ